MDVLTDIFNSAGIKKSLLVSHSVYSPWAIRFPCEKSIGFHIISQGEGYIRFENSKSKPIHLSRGDVVMVKRGYLHEVATDLKTKAKNICDVTLLKTSTPNQKAPLLTIVSGLYQLETDPIHPFFTELPEIIHIRASETLARGPLQMAEQLLALELSEKELGTDSVTKSLIDLIFHYILREWMKEAPTEKYSWMLALKDKNLSKAITSIHKEVTNDWTLDDLAKVAGLSRAAFALKFKKITGDTPAHYLARVRIQRAMNLLRTTSQNLEEIAMSIGYSDSFVFSKAFKRIQGQSPRDFKRQLLTS